MLTAAETIGSYSRRQHQPSLQSVSSATTACPISLAQQFTSHFERAGRKALDRARARRFRPRILVVATTAFVCLLVATLHADEAELTKSSGFVVDYPLKPVPFNEVQMTGDFWRARLVRQRKVLLPHAFECTKPGVAHLQAAADFLSGKKVEGHRPHCYIDSDLYKVMEGAAYLLQLERDSEIEERLDRLTALIAAAQEPDGYLYPSHTTGVGSAKDNMGDGPYQYEVHSHELYNIGHLYEAAVAYYQATGKDALLTVAEKSAQHVNRVYFEGDPRYNAGKPVLQSPGHEEIELALVKLYRVTGKRLYLDMARKFLEIRGVTYRPNGVGILAPTYAQQQAPVLEQREPVGHAVRATYLYSAMADIGVLTDDPRYRRSLEQIWKNIVDTRMHITGGLGGVHSIEGFGPPYELPNKDAYNETCAAVGNVLWNFRMFMLTHEAKYLDVAEIALFNNVLAGVNFEGNRFFYVNPLESDGRTPFNHGTPSRAPWFDTACCPSNMARLVPQVSGMIYAHVADDLYINLYAASQATVQLDASAVEVEQNTEYPNEGTINIAVSPKQPCRFRLLLRIPTWAGKQFVPGDLYSFVTPEQHPLELRVNGTDAKFNMVGGFATIDREWAPGDHVELRLPMTVRANTCHPSVKSNVQRVAFTRGPLVLCAEGVDNGGATQRFFFSTLPKSPDWTTGLATVQDTSFIQATTLAQALTSDGKAQQQPLVLTPYYAWNNRGATTMTVWFPRNSKLALFDPTTDSLSGAAATSRLDNPTPTTVLNEGDHKQGN
jgi:uncharacterized protein